MPNRKIKEHKDRIANIDNNRLPLTKKLKQHFVKVISHMDDDALGIEDVATIVHSEDENGKPTSWETRQLGLHDFDDVNA